MNLATEYLKRDPEWVHSSEAKLCFAGAPFAFILKASFKVFGEGE